MPWARWYVHRLQAPTQLMPGGSCSRLNVGLLATLWRLALALLGAVDPVWCESRPIHTIDTRDLRPVSGILHRNKNRLTRSAIEKQLRYRMTHPITEPASWLDKLSPRHMIHSLGWMSAMVSRHDAKDVFGKAFSRPPRLLLGNPVCLMFSIYYAYIYCASSGLIARPSSIIS